jgi:hypothetical protein
MSTAKFDTLSNVAGTQTVPVATVAQGSAKSWVNFDGTGTVAIRAAFNVTSITDNGAGDYTVNFTTAMPDTNYAVVANSWATGGGGFLIYGKDGVLPTTSAVTFNTSSTVAFNDSVIVGVAIFR